MADYKELLRRAISALPENNGAARRAVYEKARSALVGQLRAITPPLPARDITQHRLQLEDCIRQVEQEASEAVITLGRDPLPVRVPPSGPDAASVPQERPRMAEAPRPTPIEVPSVIEAPKVVEAARPAQRAKAEEVASKAKAADQKPADVVSIEDIIAQAAATSGVEVTAITEAATRPTGRGAPTPRPVTSKSEMPLKAPSFEPRRDVAPAAAANSRIEPVAAKPPRIEQKTSPQPVAEPVDPALSSVREVELEAPQRNASEAEGVIASAIEVLDREARGEVTELLPEKTGKQSDLGAFGVAGSKANTDDSGFVMPITPARQGGGLTIFLVVFALLLAGAGGAGFWAWREGYVDLDQMFGRAQPAVADTVTTQPTTPTLDPVQSGDAPQAAETAAGPGNTATTAAAEPTTSLEGVEIEDRLEPTPEAVVPTGTESALPDIGTGEDKGEERLPGQDAAVAAIDDPAASVDPSVLAGSQSLLLEASPDGNSGAVPFSGTVEWTQGSDELGLPTLVGTASIPARNLGVEVTIRKNSDPSLPASHLLEVDFDVSDTFIGGTISNLPGVLLKDQELVPGTPLVGASARVVGNSFLFALSASEADTANNTDLLENRRWIDLAVVYGTGRNAILTLEKDGDAQALFEKVFTAWAE